MADAAAATQAPKGGMGWGWLLTGGIFVTIAGMFLLSYPAAASASVTLFLGWMMIFVGIMGFVSAIAGRADGGLWSGMILGILAIIAGGLLASNVLAGTLTLTALFTIWLLADGTVGTILNLVRRETGWGWRLTSSLLSLLLGLMLLAAWPSSAVWLLGVYAGIAFVFRGMAMIFISFDVKRLNAAA